MIPQEDIVQSQAINSEKIQTLRELGVISQEEVPVTVGDVLYAENVITKQRRIINNAPASITESKRILKG